jgi:uncharacterized repeat protein (TIGR01451 family)
VTVSNAGPDAGTNVKVQDLLTSAFAFVSSTVSQGTYDQNTGVWSVGTLSSASTATLRLVAKAKQPGAQANAAEVIAADQFDPDSTANNHVATEDDQANATLIAQSADLSLSKIVDNGAPNVGDNVTFTITLNNAGPDTATGVTVRDRMPTGLTYVSSTPSQGTFDPATGQWAVGAIAKNTNLVLKVVAKVVERGSQTESAEITASEQFDPDSTPGNNKTGEDDLASVDVRPKSADLSLTSTLDNSTPNVGDNVKLTLTLANAGPDGATGTVVSAPLPTGLTFGSSKPSQGTYSSDTGRWDVDAVASGTSATLEIVARVDSSPAKTATAELIAVNEADSDSTPNNHLASEDDQTSGKLTPQVVDLSVSKVDVPDPVLAGQQVTYTLTVTNAGPATASDVVLTDTLPADVTFVSVTPSQGSAEKKADGSVVAALGTLARGSSATVKIVVTVKAGFEGDLANRAEVTARQFDSNTSSNVATTTTTAKLPPSRIAGSVYVDFDRDGVRDATEPGIGGVLLTRTGTDRKGQAVNITRRSDPNGAYEFANLEGGNYKLVETQPSLFNPGKATAGNSQLGGVTNNDEFFFKLGSGDEALNFNFGEEFAIISRRQKLASTP